MAPDDELISFIRTYIPSVWSLELLLLLYSDEARWWTSTELLRELRASTSLIDENLARFERQGLVVHDEGKWRFTAANLGLAALTDQLRIVYRDRPMHTIGLISRSDPVQSLAEAFRIKRDANDT